jgi:drug/metabolite transporter (DMT)-like permease
MGVSFVGATAIALDHGGGQTFGTGAGWVLLAAVCQSLFFILQKPLLGRHAPLAVTASVIWAGTLGLLPFAAGLVHTIAAAPLDATLAVVFLGVGPAALAYLTWAVVLARFAAGQAASFLYLVPPTTMVVGWLWLGELPTLLAVLGGGIAISGVAIVARFGRRPA